MIEVESAHIEGLGLLFLHDILNIQVKHGLLGALVKHFHSEMNTFHFLMGEMIVTPEDIYRILQIPFHGARVEYDVQMRVGTLELRAIFRDDLVMG